MNTGIEARAKFQRDVVIEYSADDKAADVIFGELLALQNADYPLTAGTVDYTDVISLDVPQDTWWGAMEKLRQILGGFMWADEDNKLHWTSNIGEGKGQQIRYRKNIEGITRRADFSKFANRLYVYGQGPWGGRLKLNAYTSYWFPDAVADVFSKYYVQHEYWYELWWLEGERKYGSIVADFAPMGYNHTAYAWAAGNYLAQAGNGQGKDYGRQPPTQLLYEPEYIDPGQVWALTHVYDYEKLYTKAGAGIRFNNIQVNPGDTITSANLLLGGYWYSTGSTANTRLHGEKTLTPATFSDITNYDGRTRTVASVDWDAITPWDEGHRYGSPDIKDIIQEIIDQPGWAKGNSIVIFWDDHDARSTGEFGGRKGYGYDSYYRPQLYINTPTGAQEYVQDDYSIEIHGIVSGTESDKSISSVEGLVNFAGLKLIERAWPALTYSVDLANLEAA